MTDHSTTDLKSIRERQVERHADRKRMEASGEMRHQWPESWLSIMADHDVALSLLSSPAGKPTREQVDNLSDEDERAVKLVEDCLFNEDHDGMDDDDVIAVCWLAFRALARAEQAEASRDEALRRVEYLEAHIQGAWSNSPRVDGYCCNFCSAPFVDECDDEIVHTADCPTRTIGAQPTAQTMGDE